MTHFLWRKSHFWLAIVSTTFLVILSVTGIFLAIEASMQTNAPLNIANYPNTSVADILQKKLNEDAEFVALKRTEYGFLTAEILSNDGDIIQGTIHPLTGKIHSERKKSIFFDFMKSLHRSLFLGYTGRMTVGIVAFLLTLISISGIFLIAQRQLSFKRFFSKIHFDNWYGFSHVFLGRWTLGIILIIAISGAYLSMQRFEIIPPQKNTEHSTESLQFDESEQIIWSDFELFKNTKLNDFEELIFPFSPFPEDYFILKTREKSRIINQFNGSLIDQIEKKPQHSFLKNIHTGANYFWWNFLLILGAISVLYFIFSGIKIHLKRRVKPLKNKTLKSESNILIYVGSETNNTLQFAQYLMKELKNKGKTVFLDQLNNFTSPQKSNEFIFFISSTYGNGDAPKNANQFLKKMQEIEIKHPFQFATLGFGSKDYPKFCHFAELIQKSISTSSYPQELIPFSRINNQSSNEINNWLKELGHHLDLKINPYVQKEKRLQKFKVTNHSKKDFSNLDNFWLQIDSKSSFQSGDLLAVIPAKGERQRYYSIAKWGNQLFIGVRKHELGICSNYLFQLNENELFSGWIESNKRFYYPEKDVLFIANGTGVVPFLGMIKERGTQYKDTLFWGLKSPENYQLYADKIDFLQKNNYLNRLEKIYSQVENGGRIQQLLIENEEFVKSHLQKGGVLMICGALEMEKDVRKWISSLNIQYFDSKKQILADTY